MNNALSYLYLSIAIIAEVLATSNLKASESFTRLGPTIWTILGYGVAFYSLSLTLRVLPVGIAYAIWAGIGTVLIAVVGWIWYRQALDVPAVIGIALIILGVVVINIFSKSSSH